MPQRNGLQQSRRTLVSNEKRRIELDRLLFFLPLFFINTFDYLRSHRTNRFSFSFAMITAYAEYTHTHTSSSTCPRQQRVEDEKIQFFAARTFCFFSLDSWKNDLRYSAGASPADSGTIESVFFDEATAQQITIHELSTPETVKLDLLLQTKTLSDKVIERRWRSRGSMGLFRR